MQNTKNKRSYSASDISRLIEDRKDELVFLESSYIDYKTKCTFIDHIYGEWQAKPGNIINKNYSHPARKKEKIKDTFIKNYGVDNPAKSQVIKEKVKKTNLEKYGCENPQQNTIVREKTAKTNLEKYGFENPRQNEVIKEKVKKTNLERYGGNSPMSSSIIKDKCKETHLYRYGVSSPISNPISLAKMKETNLERYGFENACFNEDVKARMKATNLINYGVEYSCLTEKAKASILKHILSNDQSLHSYCVERNVPYSWVQDIFIRKGESFALEWILHYKQNKTYLEMIVEKYLHFIKYDRKISNLVPYRPDFKLNESTFLDIDGLYYHSEIKKDLNYHFDKRRKYEESSLRVLQIREDELNDKLPIVESIINNVINKSKKIFARKTQVRVVTKEAKLFLTSNHLMGFVNAKHIGLYLEDQLVCIMSYAKDSQNILKIQRFCNILNTTVVGGFSKLLKYIESLESPREIHNWVDLRYGTGSHLESKGFYLARETLGWKWTNGRSTFNRLTCKANMDSRCLSEKEHARELRLYKIYDAGQRLYIKKIREA